MCATPAGQLQVAAAASGATRYGSSCSASGAGPSGSASQCPSTPRGPNTRMTSDAKPLSLHVVLVEAEIHWNITAVLSHRKLLILRISRLARNAPSAGFTHVLHTRELGERWGPPEPKQHGESDWLTRPGWAGKDRRVLGAPLRTRRTAALPSRSGYTEGTETTRGWH